MANIDNKKEISPIAAGITGLILGVVGTAAVALSDKDTRKKASKKAMQVKKDLLKWSENAMHDLQKIQKDVKKDASEKIDELKEKSQEVAEEAEKEIRETALKN